MKARDAQPPLPTSLALIFICRKKGKKEGARKERVPCCLSFFYTFPLFQKKRGEKTRRETASRPSSSAIATLRPLFLASGQPCIYTCRRGREKGKGREGRVPHGRPHRRWSVIFTVALRPYFSVFPSPPCERGKGKGKGKKERRERKCPACRPDPGRSACP